MGARAWDSLRTDHTQADFYIPEDREQWRAICAKPELAERAEAIASWTRDRQMTAVTSFGVGTGCLELQIHRIDRGLRLHLSDFSVATVQRLRQVFPEAASIEVADLVQADMPAANDGLTLLHRIDTEFTNSELRQIFRRLNGAGHRVILFAASGFLGPRELAKEFARRLRAKANRDPLTFAGYLRTRSVYDTFWAPGYRLRREATVGGVRFLLLEATA
jgi:hypothetical protein